MTDNIRRAFMMHSHQCCIQKPFNHKKDMGPNSGLVIHLPVKCLTRRSDIWTVSQFSPS